MTPDQILKQSQIAYKQWCKQWREHAKIHKDFPQRSFEDFRNSGIGKAILCVANGYSFEEHIDIIREYQENVDIMACDKTLGHLLKNGIRPKYCLVCDANVSYERYLKPYEGELSDTILFQNVCGNPKWTENGNWKSVYLYVNKDVMKNEIEFSELSGCKNIITAGTNVSNMMIVILVQSDNERKQNLFAYDKILTIGFDYSWREDGKYYAFDDNGGGKANYMRHIYAQSPSGKHVYTSNNLSSSASWLDLYVQTFKPPVFQCSPDSIITFGRPIADLKEQMQYRHKPEDKVAVTKLLSEKQGIEERLRYIDNRIRDIAKDHWLASQSI